jgi:Xaa-Pro aminopeptidase
LSVDYETPVLLSCAADEVAWLFNVRGGDVAYNPVCLSYGLVTPEGAALYVNKQKVAPE